MPGWPGRVPVSPGAVPAGAPPVTSYLLPPHPGPGRAASPPEKGLVRGPRRPV